MTTQDVPSTQLEDIPPCPKGIPQEAWIAQYHKEMKSLDDGVERFEASCKKAKEYGAETRTIPGQALLSRMVQPVADALDAWIKTANSGKPGPRHEVLPLFQALPSTTVASYLACKAVVDELTMETRTANRLAFVIAERLETEIRVRTMMEAPHARRATKAIMQKTKRQAQGYKTTRAILIRAANKGLAVKLPKFNMRARALLGGCLIQLIMDTTGVIEFREDFVNGSTSTKMVVPSAETKRWLAGRMEALKESSPYYTPLVCSPRPWDNPYEGGYWHLPVPLVRRAKPAYLEELANSVNIQNVYEAVNALQATAWEVNPVVQYVLAQLWESQDYPASFMVKAEDEHLPHCDKATMSNEEFKKAVMRLQQLRAKHKEDASKRKALMQTIQAAGEYLGSPLWFAYNLDFRGRIYPIATHLTPQGDDVQRGLLCFAKSKLVETQEQVDCLAIHGANCWGNKVDKQGFKARIAWITEHEDLIIASAADPLSNREWMKADEPFQFLAFCLEWTTFLGEGLGVFRTKLPVAVDGTCSGLQHFSALLRDPIGASATNLTPSEIPSDIYAVVAHKTMEKVKAILAVEPENIMAKGWVDFGIDRGCAKRPVMTLPYGATAYSAREYVQDWLDEKMLGGKASTFGEHGTFKASLWLTPHLWAAIGETVVAARQAMDWLQDVARIVAKSGNPVWWTTPTGFQVFQGYPNTKQRRVDTALQGSKVFVSYREETKGYDSGKAASGLAPNFVHSMDASALTLTVNGCMAEGIDAFGMIHDSFATHCTDMPKMNRILRDVFVDMYTKHDVLAEFESAVREVLPKDAKLPPRPTMGSLDINQVRDSLYFFS
jgi:DNA-directed RNA polymerase